ncbi:unnamed protein product [Heligmosomoides polygyrus]|uniref:HTH_48 domain-containing protein n=1 Tax=Heligmosomoides polygyrus TaxID=6339 RepID=A0A183GIV2_HELPZ|nr:unnamed protein product [Heligmosomoides polygyrus]
MAKKNVLDCKEVRPLLDELKEQGTARVTGITSVERWARSRSPTTEKVWFRKFKNGDIGLEDQPRSGIPVAVNEERILELV